MSTDDRSPLPRTTEDVPPKRRRGRPRRDERGPDEPDTRAAILRSAALLFAKRGYESASLADIATGAGATTGAIYAHFRGKPELLVEVVRETLAFLSYRTGNVDATRGPASLEGYVRWLLHADQRTTRQLINEVFTTADRDPQVFEMVNEYADGEAEAIAEMLRRWRAEGLCTPPADEMIVARQFFVEVLGLCRVDCLAPELSGNRAWNELIRLRVAQLTGAEPGR